MKIYIRSVACLSPQRTFGNVDFLSDMIEYKGTRLRALEPDYSEFIDSKLIRRMSHIIKMGVFAAQECLKLSYVKMPDAIIVGTAYGCLEDTVAFLTQIIDQDEEFLLPTAFIQSTHNTVAAQIALILKCHQYNNTFVHKGISFESALMDGIMLLKENEANNILVGGIDEMTDKSFTILTRLGLYRRSPVSNLSIYETNSKGTIGGEGAVFFLLTDKHSAENMAELTSVITFYKPKDQAEIELKIIGFLANHSLQIDDIDLVITGKNGDLKNDKLYHQLGITLFSNKALANYKHLCGEYPTSSAFALWLASNIIKREIIPGIVIERNIISRKPKRILIFNHYQNTYYSLMLVSAY